MAKKSFRSSEEVDELIISFAAFRQRWPALVRQLQAQLNLVGNDLNISLNPTPIATFAEFVGTACEYVERNRGGKTPVVPFTTIGRGELRSWLSLQEKWERRAKDRFVFNHVSLTVYLGYGGEVFKPQIFRAEWPGIANWASSGFGFQSPGAGHPHWQFDAMAALREKDINRREQSLAVLREEHVVKDFVAGELKTDVLHDLKQAAFERMHFASVAPWWRKGTSEAFGIHMNAPRSAEEIARWVLETVTYMKQELGRLLIAP